MKKFNIAILLSAAGIMFADNAYAEIVPSYLISDGMVVQRNRPVILWGSGASGEKVEVQATGEDYNSQAETVVSDDGQWQVALSEMPAGEGYTIVINGKSINNVASGNVILCAGQSNMELPVRRVTDRFADEIAAYSNRLVRQIKAPQVIEFHSPLANAPASQWQETTPETAMGFSALGYFLGKELNALENVPIGIVNASWGGTPVEAWMSEKALLPWPKAISELLIYQDDEYRKRIKQLEGENFSRWNLALWKGDPGCQSSSKWYEEDLNDEGWPEVEMFSQVWSTDGLNPVNGSHWFRKNINLPSSAAGKEAILRLGCIVDADSVYVNGKFVGTTSYQYPPRIYKVPAGLLHEGENNVTIRMISQNGMPHFVAEKPYKLIVGDEEYGLEGVWRYNRGAVMPSGPGMQFYQYCPTVLYNGMIHPLASMQFAAAVWYQGESNVGRRNLYSDQLQAMIADWRETLSQPQLPFYIVELADFLHPSDVGGRNAWQEMRQQQAAAAKNSENVYLIHNSDLGEWNDIHPLDKKTLAERIANAINSK